MEPAVVSTVRGWTRPHFPWLQGRLCKHPQQVGGAPVPHGPDPHPLVFWMVESLGLVSAIPQGWGLDKPHAPARSYMKAFPFVATGVGTHVPGPGSTVCTRLSTLSRTVPEASRLLLRLGADSRGAGVRAGMRA